ncbi:hypothetical protein [Microcoleus sp. F4-D5]|uniref:hypothetical protein n=1 Tax=Microcoleus sp. F4-D5 TaxID=2818760 RepID=UPI002FCFB615
MPTPQELCGTGILRGTGILPVAGEKYPPHKSCVAQAFCLWRVITQAGEIVLT